MKTIMFRSMSFILLLTQLSVFNFGQIKPDSNIQPLEQGKPIERELKGGEVHVYSVQLKADQFLNLIVDQRGIDVVVLLFAPDGKQLAEVDSPNGNQGPEPVSVLSKTTGDDRWLTVTTKVEDPVYFTRPYLTSSDFKKLPDASGWSPTPCAAR